MIKHGLCLAAKVDFLAGVHHPSDRYMLALYTNAADLGPDTRAYESQGEVQGPGYRRGGVALKGAKVWADKSCAYLTFDSVRFTNASITAYGALIYNASKGNRALLVVDFGGAHTSTAGPFDVHLPADLITFE